MTQSRTTHRRRRSKKNQNRLLGTVRAVPELLWLAIAIIGIFLLTVYPQARAAMTSAAEQAVDTVTPTARQLRALLLTAVTTTTPVELFGLMLVLVGALAILYRLRWRLIHSQSLTEVLCPRCGGKIHRVHRHNVDRLVNRFLPVHRYRCWNDACKWEGLRVRDPSRPAPAASRSEA